MKSKLSVLFAILALICVLVVFNFGKVRSVFQATPDEVVTEVPAKEITLGGMDSFFKGAGWIDFSGKPSLTDPKFFDGTKAIYVHLWASWCAPCLNEIPELIEYAKKHKDQAYFVLVSLDDSQEDLTKFLKSFPAMNSDLFFKIWDQDKKLSKFVDADRLPMTIVLDRKTGKLREVRSVVNWKTL